MEEVQCYALHDLGRLSPRTGGIMAIQAVSTIQHTKKPKTLENDRWKP
jgi:hypothetical protein